MHDPTTATTTPAGAGESTGERFDEPRADRPPTADETRAAERAAHDVDLDAVARHEREMAERGAAVRGEGEIEPSRGEPPRHAAPEGEHPAT